MATLGHIAAEHARQDAQRMFQRTITAWAQDVLRLRAAGLDRPCARPAGALVTAPARKAA